VALNRGRWSVGDDENSKGAMGNMRVGEAWEWDS
jgi:hypothetical protein